jgi:endonuclease/exonuclease/phosphatase family metal-dependent hydrolase
VDGYRAALAQSPPKAANVVRVATFNVSFNRPQSGQLIRDLETGSREAQQVATILRTVRPDIVLLNEFDHDADGREVRLFQEQYLRAVNVAPDTLPLNLPHTFTDFVNTGEPSGLDLNQDGQSDGPQDAFGFGRFPGQYGMLVLSAYPIDTRAVRTFRKFLWRDLPDAAVPVDSKTGQPWYPPEVWSRLRLSSKSHWIVPITVGEQTLHIVAAHPTPPAFDGPEDRNGRRNHDEIRLLRELLSDENRHWLSDDRGAVGGLPVHSAFVVCGDLNADPVDGSSYRHAIQRLLTHPHIQNPNPISVGGRQATGRQGGINEQHKGDPAQDTADFSDRQVGNLRVDYVLPSQNLQVVAAGIFWPAEDDRHFELMNCSDHRLVWVDVQMTP